MTKTHHIASVILAFAFAISPLLTSAQSHTDTVSADDISRAIQTLLLQGIPEHNILPHPAHPMACNKELRDELATGIKTAADAYNVPPFLLVAIAFREGSFKNTAKGGIGERSTFQMLPRIAKLAAAIDSRCNLKTYEGAAFCTAIWLNNLSAPKRCTSHEGALLKYATGYTCFPLRKKHVWIVKDRFGIAEQLAEFVRD
ncbi:MAG: hypothetical protein GY854_21700 [Deltaproteobacteria bacterium]|nr:hypothetical protein [Deltaproteobacteria bacterium]